MALIGVDPATYIPADKLSLVYVGGAAFQAKDSEGAVTELSAAKLTALGLSAADLPAVVFTEDIPAEDPTIANVSGVSIARSAKASTKYVEQLAQNKVDKAIFASAVTQLDIDVQAVEAGVAANAEEIGKLKTADEGLDGRLDAVEQTLEKLGDVEGGSIADALAKKVDKTAFETYQGQVTEALAGKVDNGTLASYKEEVAGTVAGINQAVGKKLEASAFNTFKSEDYDVKMAALDGQIADRYTKAEVNEAIASQVASVFKFKGSVADIDALDAIEVKVEGDVYHVESNKTEYVWVGPKGEEEGRWEELGLTVSLDGYATEEFVTSKGYATETYVQGYAYDKATADGKYQTIAAAGQDKEALQTAINGKVAQGDFDTLNAKVTGENGLEAKVAANTAKFADYYTSAQIDTKLGEAASAVDTKLADYAKSADVASTYVTKEFADGENGYATKAGLAGVSGDLTTLTGRVAANEAAITAHATEFNTLSGKVAANELAISNNAKAIEANAEAIEGKAAKVDVVFVEDSAAKALELNKWYIVSAAFTGTLPAGNNGDMVKISVVEGGSSAKVIANGATILGESKPCMLGVTEDGFEVYNETYVFVYNNGNWDIL